MEKLFIIKIGGNVIDNDEKLRTFLQSFALLSSCKILVHGGGKIATDIGNRLGIQSRYINGRRITDDATIDLVTMVYGGLINKKIVAQLQMLKCNAIGLTGADGNIIPALKRTAKTITNHSGIDEIIDYGWVGDISNSFIKSDNIQMLNNQNFVPVFAPLTHDGAGNILNTNADTIASALAVALSGLYDVRLVYCFEKKGVLENIHDETSVIHLINRQKYRQLLNEQKLFAGMIPKIDNAFAAVDAGVSDVVIGSADDLIENTSATAAGTLITQ